MYICIFFFIRFEEEIGIPNYVELTPGAQTYNQIKQNLFNSINGYMTEHDSTHSYIENTGKYQPLIKHVQTQIKTFTNIIIKE